jgi:formiminotetrahydrofolate cyclodeaminase
MVCGLTVGKKKYAEVEPRVREIGQWLEALKDQLYALTEEDAQAYERVVAAYALPKTNEQETALRTAKIEESLKGATEVPLGTAEAALGAMKLLHVLRPMCNPNVLSDLGVGALMGHAAVKGAAYNVYINLSSLKDERFRRACEERLARTLKDAQHIAEDIEASIRFS